MTLTPASIIWWVYTVGLTYFCLKFTLWYVGVPKEKGWARTWLKRISLLEVEVVNLFKKDREKHRVVVMYEDRVKTLDVKYPDDGLLRLEDGTVYYLNPSRTVHVFVHGYVNEVDGARVHMEVDPRDVHKRVRRLEFEPSFTFKNAYDNKILEQLFKSVEGKSFDDFVLWAMAAVLIILAFLVWNMNNHLTELMRFIGMEVTGWLL